MVGILVIWFYFKTTVARLGFGSGLTMVKPLFVVSSFVIVVVVVVSFI